jgi:hypothetical protein
MTNARTLAMFVFFYFFLIFSFLLYDCILKAKGSGTNIYMKEKQCRKFENFYHLVIHPKFKPIPSSKTSVNGNKIISNFDLKHSDHVT